MRLREPLNQLVLREVPGPGAYCDALGDVLNRDGTPKGQYVARDRAVDAAAAADPTIHACPVLRRTPGSQWP